MSDYVGKILSILLSFVVCFVGPTAIYVVFTNGFSQQAIINETQAFVDSVIDTRSITKDQLADFNLGVNSHGHIVDVSIKRYVKTIEPDPKNGGTYVTYVLADNNYRYNTGDQIKVEVKTIGYNGLEKLVMSTVGLLSPKLEYSVTARVR